MLYDVKALFEGFAAGTAVSADGVRMVPLSFSSRHTDVLVEEDRPVAANSVYRAALFLPDQPGPHRRLAVFFHGLNEGTEAKLFPWAANLARRGAPALIFPSAFHLARRPASFLERRADAFAARRAVAGNLRSSPYNATLSQRMAERPDRFLRGMLQTWRDLLDLARQLRAGDNPALAAHFLPGTTLDFVGYSIGGYLAELALLADPDGLFADSRAVLFATGAALAQVRPQTILILDTDAQDTLTRAYDTEQARADQHPWLAELGASASEARWLNAMLYATEPLKEALSAVRSRALVIANPHDQVFPLDAVTDALGALPRQEIAMGLHELPFNQSTPLGETYSDREGRRLLLTVVRSYTVAEELRAAFAAFVDACDAHLRPQGR